mgnify:CR=1 FL=1
MVSLTNHDRVDTNHRTELDEALHERFVRLNAVPILECFVVRQTHHDLLSEKTFGS